MTKNVEERDVGKIVMGVIVFLVFSSFPVLVGVAHFMNSSEPGAAPETAGAQEEIFWKPPAKAQPPPGKKILTNEEKIKEANDFYFMGNPKDLDIELLPSPDPNAPAPTTPEYDLNRDFIFLAIQILRKQSILGLVLSQFREPGSAKNNILLKELTTAADTCGVFSATIEKLTGKILKMEESVSDETYKRAYVLNRLTSHPVARNLVTAFKPAAGLQSPDPTYKLTLSSSKTTQEIYDQICDKALLEIPPEAHHVLIYHCGFTPLKKKEVEGEEGGGEEPDVYDPENRILLYNPDATALILWDAAKEDFQAGDEDTADERVVELIDLLSLLPEGAFVDEWLTLVSKYSHKMDSGLIHHLVVLAYNYVHMKLYDAAKKVLDERVESGRVMEGLYPAVHPIFNTKKYQKPAKERLPVKNLLNFDVSWSLVVDRKSCKVQKKDFFRADAKIEQLRPHLCRELRHMFDHSNEFKVCAMDGKKIFPERSPDPKNPKSLYSSYSMIAALYERALSASFTKKGDRFHPSSETDPRTMAMLAYLQRQIIVFDLVCFVPLDAGFLYKPLDLTLFKDAYQATAKTASMDVPMRLYEGTLLGEPDQGIYPDLLLDPRGVALTAKALKLCVEQRLKLGIDAYMTILREYMVNPELGTEAWYTKTFVAEPHNQKAVLRILKHNIFQGEDPKAPEEEEENGKGKGKPQGQ